MRIENVNRARFAAKAGQVALWVSAENQQAELIDANI